MDDNFADAPISITEARSERDRDAAKWTARDVLISMLREIDRGELTVDTMFIAFRTAPSEAKPFGHLSYRQRGDDPMATIGVAETVLSSFRERTVA